MKAESLEIKVACMTWLRFGRQMPFVADEVGFHWLADVAGADERSLIEIEIKTSVSDLKRDFSAKGTKHWKYLNAPADFSWVPNRMYFAVPWELATRTAEELEKAAPNYGVLSYTEPAGDYSEVPWKRLCVAKRAKPIHDRAPSERVRHIFLKRMGSDLCHFHMMRHHYGGLMDHMTDLSRKMVKPEADAVETFED